MKVIPPFVIEAVRRFGKKNPRFFFTLQIVSATIGGISLLISYIESNGFDLPPIFDVVSDLSVKVGALTAILVAQCTVDDDAK